MPEFGPRSFGKANSFRPLPPFLVNLWSKSDSSTEKMQYTSHVALSFMFPTLKKTAYSRFRLIGPPVNRVSRLIGPNC